MAILLPGSELSADGPRDSRNPCGRSSWGIQIRRRIVQIPPKIVFSHAFSCLPDVIQRILDRTRFWPAVMFLKIGLELLLGFVRVHKKLPPRAER